MLVQMWVLSAWSWAIGSTQRAYGFGILLQNKYLSIAKCKTAIHPVHQRLKGQNNFSLINELIGGYYFNIWYAINSTEEFQ